MGKRYSLEDDLMPIVRGEVPVPNMETTDLGGAVANIAAVGHSLRPEWGYAKMADNHKVWTFYFLTPAAMGSARGDNPSLDGGGYMLVYYGYPKGGYAAKFAICKHEKKTAVGANHERGWHPGACVKCGLDMTVDSGD